MLNTTATADLADQVAGICARHAAAEGPMLPILHDIQADFGYIPEAAIPVVAKALNQTAAEVHGVMSFYHDFKSAPSGRHTVKICRAEACQAMGANGLADAAKARLGVDWHGTTKGGEVTLEPVYCLGLCACAPAAMVDGQVIGRVDDARLNAVFAEAGL